MFKKIVPLFILFFITTFAIAQTVIKGKVLDAISLQPIEAALITTHSNNKSENFLSNENGFFIVTSIKESMSLQVSSIGYEKQTLIINSTQEVNIRLTPTALNLSQVVLNSNNFSKLNTVNKIDLKLKPVSNTQELMRIVPGLFIAQHAGGGKAEQIFLRGFDCDHGTDVNVSVDGMPVNMVSHAHGQGYADAHFIIPETINNIDFGTGPYYTQQGNLTTAGYVSFNTYKNIAQSFIQTEVGNFNTYRTVGLFDLFKKNKEKQSAFIAAEIYYSDGATIDKQNFNRYNLFAKYNLSLSQKTAITTTVSAFKSNWNASGQVPTRAVENGLIDRFGSIDNSEGGNTERYNFNTILSHQFNNKTHFTNQFYYTKYKFNLYSNFSFYLNNPVDGDEINQAEGRNVLGYLSKLEKKYFTGNITLQSNYGAGFRYDVTSDSKLSYVTKRQFLSHIKLGNIKELNSFAYINQQINWGKWMINIGARFDHFSFDYFDKLSSTKLPYQQQNIISPKLNIQYTLNKNVQVYIKSGKGFHSSDTRLVVANDGKEILPAAYGSDIGLILKPNKNLYINIAAWYLNLNQEFVYVGDDGNIEPSGKTTRRGIDIITRYQFNNNLFLSANFNVTKPRATNEHKGSNYIPLAPTFTSTGGLYFKKTQGFNGSMSYRFIQDRPANEDNSIVAKGYFLADASINYTKPKYQIGLAVENIFNVKWNEAQFATTSQLKNETTPITELNFTPGTPAFAKFKVVLFF